MTDLPELIELDQHYLVEHYGDCPFYESLEEYLEHPESASDLTGDSEDVVESN